MRRRAWTALAVLGATLAVVGADATVVYGSAINVFIGTSTIPSLEDATKANLWMDTNGGTCVRQAVPAAYSDATACDSFDEAYQAASLGDTVRLVDNSTFTGYTNFSAIDSNAEGYMDGPSKTCTTGGSKVTFDGGSNVAIGGLDITDTDCLAFKDLLAGGETPANTVDKVVDLTRDDHISLDNVDVSGQWQKVDVVGLSGGDDDVTWTNSSICCNMNQKLVFIDDFSNPGTQQTDITFDHMDVGDMAYDANTYPGDQIPHGECWWLQNTTRMTISNSITHDCISTGAMNWSGSGLNLNLHWFNTVWTEAYDYVGGVDVVPGPTVGYRGNEVGTFIQDAGFDSTGVIEYSVFKQLVTISSWDSLTWRGNIDKQQTCAGAEVTYLYNRHVGADCSASDVQDSGALDSSRFADAAGLDYRPASGSVAQVDAGDPSTCPATDYLDRARSVGSCDQGAYEGP